MSAAPRCEYCRQHWPANSDHEQQSIMSGKWSRLCRRCANKRVRFGGPFFRRIPALAAVTDEGEG